MEITFKEYAEACEIINKFNGQCRRIRESRKAKESDDIDVLLFEARKELAEYCRYEKRLVKSGRYTRYLKGVVRLDIVKDIKELLKRKFKK